MSSKTYPTNDVERALFATGARFVLGVDEVGRGAIAGPVAVGVALLDFKHTDIDNIPNGLRDSKLLTEKQREQLYEPVSEWVAAYAVGFSSAEEIDSLGIVESLATAAGRAIGDLLRNSVVASQLASDGAHILLDGSHNWLGFRAGGFPVTVRPKADRDCVSVAAASVLAKVQRDRYMVELAQIHPHYGFDGHKGYASASHIAALKERGPSKIHRVTWLKKILQTDALRGLENADLGEGLN